MVSLVLYFLWLDMVTMSLENEYVALPSLCSHTRPPLTTKPTTHTTTHDQGKYPLNNFNKVCFLATSISNGLLVEIFLYLLFAVGKALLK